MSPIARRRSPVWPRLYRLLIIILDANYLSMELISKLCNELFWPSPILLLFVHVCYLCALRIILCSDFSVCYNNCVFLMPFYFPDEKSNRHEYIAIKIYQWPAMFYRKLLFFILIQIFEVECYVKNWCDKEIINMAFKIQVTSWKLRH